MFPVVPVKFIVAGVVALGLCATGLYTFWRIDTLTSQLALANKVSDYAIETNKNLIKTIDALQAERQRINESLAMAQAENQKRAAALAKTRKAINDTNDQSPVAPVVRDAIVGVRDGLQAGH
jgi:hypothetical protein